MNVKVNKWVDLADRAGWTFIQSAAASFVVLGWDGWQDVLKVAIGAAIVSIGKTSVAQRVGDSPVGDMVPGASAVEPVAKAA